MLRLIKMHLALALLGLGLVHGSMYQECLKMFHPNNYMSQLPTLSLPYVNSVPIPNAAAAIKPSPVVTTKVINIVTKYIYKNPVCIRYTKKNACATSAAQKLKNKMEYLVTKELFVRDNKKERKSDDAEEFGLFVEGSEDPRPFSKENGKTPRLSSEDVKEMLIEDRLDQLETVLPHYTRRRVYQTTTITVTKVRSNNRATATLLAKNCIPQGFEVCPPPVKKRKSKVARFTNSSEEEHFFG